jgi:hypothetical protein
MSPVKQDREAAEAAVLAEAMDALRRTEVEKAMDILATRLISLELKATGKESEGKEWECRTPSYKTLAGSGR